MRKNKKSNPLLALSTAALALPSMTPHTGLAQDGINTERTFSYRYSSYSEAPIPGSVTASGEDTDRYEIDVHQLRFESPITEQTAINVDVLSESMSGASPWYVSRDAEGSPIQVMSGATIEEQRNDLDVSFTTYNSDSITTTGLSYSKENDYSSFGVRTNYTWLLNEKNTSIQLGASASQDFIDATQDQNSTLVRVTDEEKTSTSLSIGLSQVLSKSSVMSTSFNLATFSGFMSDPYKQILILDIDGNGTNGIVPDSRPDRKNQWAWSTNYRRNVEAAKGALHLDYRYFGSNWETDSHTVDLRWYQNLGYGWQVVPSIRYYSQGAAVFFQNWYEFERADGYQSSDYRLSEYSAISARLKVSKRFNFGAVYLSFEDYTSDASSNNPLLASPALVDFTHITFGFDVRL